MVRRLVSTWLPNAPASAGRHTVQPFGKADRLTQLKAELLAISRKVLEQALQWKTSLTLWQWCSSMLNKTLIQSDVNFSL